MNKEKVVFIDRDGTLIELIPYLIDPNKIKFLDGTLEGLSIMKKENIKLVIITNQSGIGRGFFTEKDLNLFHKVFEEKLKKCGVFVDGIFFCPHSPEDECGCRKPKTKLLHQAVSSLKMKSSNYFFIGDTISDILAGNDFGCKTILVETGYGKKERLKLDSKSIRPNKIASNLKDAAEWIVSHQ